MKMVSLDKGIMDIIYKQFPSGTECNGCNWETPVLYDVLLPKRTLKNIRRNGKCADCFMDFIVGSGIKLFAMEK